MKPPPFSYHDPKTAEEAVGLLGRLENAKLLAGGQSLMPMLNMRFVLPDHIIDLNRVEQLSYVREAGGSVLVGAMTRQRELEYSELIQRRVPIVREAIEQVGHRQTRNRGTIGGSLCHLDPAAELVTVAAALDATVAVIGLRGKRDIAFADFPTGYMASALKSDELLVEIRLPIWANGHGFAFVEFARRHGDFSIVSAAALMEADRAGKITRVSVVVGGIAAAPTKVIALETVLSGQTPTDDTIHRACEACRSLTAFDDIHASSSYRQHLAAVLCKRALVAARSRLHSGSK
jgi:aerobic carbon-monoxide dehydrogenase medium subunit